MSEMPVFFAHSELAIGLGLWAVVVLALVFLERRGSDALDRLVGPSLRARLVDRPSPWRRWARVALLGIAGFAMVGALMQPQWGLRFVSTPRVGAEIMIALDVSRSMLADDAKPSRLERAKAEVSDLLAYLEDDYVGLIAFAGRASVLSPMTPDKSFLRLALESAGPHSVSRGGTRLAEPILRAVAGMGEPGPAQRALILITDGEDHDSFAMDAARAAAEAGITIIAIGFGDEAGSEIYFTDPTTGARSPVRDADGRPVVSRLDGEMLREIALATNGAFVPAGTGVLDLASIYDAHIAKLTRGQIDDRGRTIRDEAFQFFVLLALVCLVAAISVASVGAVRGGRIVGLGVVLLALSLQAGPAEAQAEGASPPPATESEHGSSDAKEAPRAKFNRANAMLEAAAPVASTALLRAARRDATDDVELRYAATYNLGVAAATRADALIAEKPAEALEALYEAADWFREAAAARPDETDPRHNLEVTLRRALVLADEIASKDQRGLEAEFDAMIETQRERVGFSAALLEEVVRSGELDAAEAMRDAFQDAATAQRIIMADASALGERVERKRQQVLSIPEEERSPEQALEAMQLEAALAHLDSAIGRMGQTRRQLRQRRAERAYRRGSSALGDLKRARDQFRHPVEQIGSLLAEVGYLARSTAALSTSGLPDQDAGDTMPRPSLPAFLTRESVEDDSARLELRVEELAERLVVAAERANAATASPAAPPAEDAAAEAAQRLALQESAPLVGDAADAMEATTTAIGTSRYDEALTQEGVAAEALAAAQERFFDLRQLLNATHADQAAIATIAGSKEPNLVHSRGEHVTRLTMLQAKNGLRGSRLADLLEREREDRIARLEAEGAADVAPDEDPGRSPVAIEEQRFALADQILERASLAMAESSKGLESPIESGEIDWPTTADAAGEAQSHLDTLRTLFFTIAEHVERLARDQVEVRDRSQDALALAVTENPPSSEGEGEGEGEADSATTTNAEGVEPRGPGTLARTRELSVDQSELESRGGEIADALFVQAEQTAGEAPQDGAPEGASETEGNTQEERDRIRRAAEHVASAQLAMQDAQTSLADEESPLAPVPDAQSLAIEELGEALRLLSPPPPPEDPDSEQEQSEDSDGGEGESSPESESGNEGGQSSPPESEPEESDEESMDDPSQLLQGVRDRDAERRRERERDQQRRRAEPVDKDW
jgi:Ca-activated chloride channel family protein